MMAYSALSTKPSPLVSALPNPGPRISSVDASVREILPSRSSSIELKVPRVVVKFRAGGAEPCPAAVDWLGALCPGTVDWPGTLD